MPPQLPPESNYDPKKLDKFFAIVAVVLLAAVVGLFVKDYSRQWKSYQKEYRAMEVEKARVKLDAEEIDLSKNEEYQAIVKNIAEAKKESSSQESQYSAINAKLTSALAQERLHTQELQFAKAKFDALKYQYSKAADEKLPSASSLKTQLTAIGAKIARYRVIVESDNAQVKSYTDELDSLNKKTKELEKKRMALAKKKEILERKLSRIDIAKMTPANQLAEMVRDMPIIDLANPNYKIQQIVLKEIPEDVNFMKVPRVDRCTTCHMGIANPDFKNAAQPLRAHPNLELFMDKNSPHPVDLFGCSTCHGGRGRATDFVSAAHTPRDEHQKKEWEKKYNWHEMEHWENPMLPAQFIQAGCFKCHEGQEVIKGAEKLNLGLNLIERAGCYGCHVIDKYKDWPRSGPSLEYLSAKTTTQWAYHWIMDPKAIRHNTWMPSYFNQSNNSDPVSLKRSEQEIHSMVHFLFANSKDFKVDPVSVKGDPVKGKELVAALGCMACHEVASDKKEVHRDRKQLHREFGPNLIGLGSKTSQEWLYQWLKNPDRYHPQTKMPNMRISDSESADMAAYLVQEKSPYVNKPVPAVDEKVLDEIVLDFLKKSESMAGADKKLKSMKRDDKLSFAGQRLIREYGCFACHKITGFENEKPIGVELTEEGSKSIHRLDFGFVKIEHTKESWFKQKLLDPRIFDQGKVLDPLERIKMPNFNFTDKEAEAVTTVLLGLVKDKPNSSKMARQGVKGGFINNGEKIIRQFNCQSCHLIDGQGAYIQDSVMDWLVKYQGKDANDAKSIVSSYSPPNLVGEGQKVQAQWLFEFLHDPSQIRPWLSVRMPSYTYQTNQLNSLVKYFNYLDNEEFPFTDIYHPNLTKEEFVAAEKLFSKEIFGCAQCHIVGDKMPEGTPDSWAPNFALASKRLKPEWIIKWLKNPAEMLPGTKMPTYYDPKDFEHSGPPDILNGDSNRQIKVLRDYLLTITNAPETGSAEAAPAPKAEAQSK